MPVMLTSEMHILTGAYFRVEALHGSCVLCAWQNSVYASSMTGRSWRYQPCAQVSNAASESQDVLKYLRALEPHWQPLYGQSMADVQASLPALLSNVATMGAIARWGAQSCCPPLGLHGGMAPSAGMSQ